MKLFKVLIYVVFYMSRAKKYHLSGINLNSNSWVYSNMVAKMATVVGDVTDLQQRHHPKICLILSCLLAQIGIVTTLSSGQEYQQF